MSTVVGIDLGTTFSAVAYVDPRTKLPVIIPNREGRRITPSVIQFLNGEIIFGSEAEESFIAGEPDCIATFKRSIGSEEPHCYVSGKPYTSEQLSAMLLRHLKEDAEAYLHDHIREAVITVPAYFYSTERAATIRAAEAAGIHVRKLIDEPNAAALAYGLNHWRENANILVYDLGGGTFDVSLVHMGAGGLLSTVATRGNHILGGRDWDERMLDILTEKFEAETELPIRENINLTAMLRGMSEGVKKSLSAQNMQSVKVSAHFPRIGRCTVTVTREEFDARTADLLESTGTLCRAVLDNYGFTERDVTDILLVGGSTRMPQVSAYLEAMFGRRPLCHVNPDEAVALGAAIQTQKAPEQYSALAVQVVDGKKKTDLAASGLSAGAVTVLQERKMDTPGALSLQETTAHAMGVVAIHDRTNRYYNEVIIPADHPRPVRAAKRFRFITSPHTANELAIYVVQGDDDNLMQCQIPYKYVVSGIRHIEDGERLGTVIRIQYSYDRNGVIHVQARQEDDKKDLPIRCESHIGDTARFGRPVVSGSGAGGEHLAVLGGQSLAHKYRSITFSNVEWQQFDRVTHHPSGAHYGEPTVHVIANEKNIEFHGYNISQMDEGVRYTIDAGDAFEIECDINTSTISPHPGGALTILLGAISARLDQDGGDILLDGQAAAQVGSQFHLKMTYENCGQYAVEIDGKPVGALFRETAGSVEIEFFFAHGSHDCEQLSHAYVSDICMMQSAAGEDDSPDTETWDD